MKSLVQLLNSIKVGYKHNSNSINVKKNKLKIKFLKYLCELGYIRNYEILDNNIIIYLLKNELLSNKINTVDIKIISKRSYKVYKKFHEIDDYYNQIQLGYGYNRFKTKVTNNLNVNRLKTVIMSTKKGFMTQLEASYLKLGGEIICIIY